MNNDQYIDLNEAVKLLPAQPHPGTVWRWVTKGRAINGKRIHLWGAPGARGRIYTTPAQVQAFIDACAMAMREEAPETISAKREAEMASAEASLRRKGRKNP